MYSRWIAVTITLAVGSTVAPATAQNARRSTVSPTSFAHSRAGAAATTSSIQFAKQAPRIGDQVEQTIALEMRLTTSVREGNQLLQKNDTTMQSDQRRAVTTTGVVDGRTQAVLVRYLSAGKRLTTAAVGQSADGQPPETTRSITQPVEGKAYRCRREPGENGKLLVTDEQGLLPPLDEYEIVAQGMEMVGRPNPLADFLAGRTVTVGDKLTLPVDVASRLFGIGERLGDVKHFDLTLQEVRADGGRGQAVFHASVDAASNDSSQMRMQLEGPLVIDVDSCRALQTHLAGPIAMTESRGTYSTAYQLISTGHLSIAIDATYRDTTR